MNEPIATAGPDESAHAPSVEDVLRNELAYGDAMLGTVGPILGHLVLNHDQALFNDAIVARVRGMLTSVAGEILEIEARHRRAVAPAADIAEDQDRSSDPRAARTSERRDQLAQAIAGNSDLLTHCHALAIEFEAAERLKARNALDPVLTPFLQGAIAAKDPALASTAMAALASQARFMEQQRRMTLPLAELPGPLARHAIDAWLAGSADVLDSEESAAAAAALRNATSGERKRLGLFADLMENSGNGMASALSIPHAGISMFVSALAALSGMSRENATLCTKDRQMARLALSLRGAGLKAQTIEEQFHYLHPEIELPEDFDTVRPETARAMLAGG